ncbi:YeeE/YedE thiosulfate transporter family protein [Methylomarinum sp. Ch1-1]|uniref:YeeE/YedE thiosulfate transporter family protein n=1 Tax=Methylomarinum roseum TaxID=3067653 RepID=A0AAU7NUT5_9GAMM|nr:YeeE/YedE thiosulfate transporter family protein [Methylomarinum sp. Ch1-1]MDP4519187.1 YeeE/YedE thiosulfate transporter family protein [Methylomarinum sp. Ch1-1]
MENFTPYSALLGGALIGLSAIILLLFNGRIAGISGIMNGVFKSPRDEVSWRSLFLAGLIIGALLFQWIAPGFVSPRAGYPLWLVALGGFLVGIGTRLGGGCTSGHGICGIANLSLRSILATLTFMATGFVTVYLIRHVFTLT